MVHPAKRDAWVTALLVVIGSVITGLGAFLTALALTGTWPALLSGVPLLLSGLLVISILTSTKYEITPDTLDIRLGPIRWRVPLADIAEVVPEDAVFAACYDHSFIPRDRGRVDIVARAGEIAHFVAARGLMQHDNFVPSTRENVLADADELNGGHLLGVRADRAGLLAGLDIPDLDGIVGPGAGDRRSVGFPAHVEHVMRVPFERTNVIASLDVENLHEFVGPA